MEGGQAQARICPAPRPLRAGTSRGRAAVNIVSRQTTEGFDDLLVQRGKRKSLLSYVFFQASEDVSHEVAQAFARILIVSLLTLFFLVNALQRRRSAATFSSGSPMTRSPSPTTS